MENKFEATHRSVTWTNSESILAKAFHRKHFIENISVDFSLARILQDLNMVSTGSDDSDEEPVDHEDEQHFGNMRMVNPFIWSIGWLYSIGSILLDGSIRWFYWMTQIESLN